MKNSIITILLCLLPLTSLAIGQTVTPEIVELGSNSSWQELHDPRGKIVSIPAGTALPLRIKVSGDILTGDFPVAELRFAQPVFLYFPMKGNKAPLLSLNGNQWSSLRKQLSGSIDLDSGNGEPWLLELQVREKK